MYGNLNPSTNAWPFTPEHMTTDDVTGWAVVDNRDVVHPVAVSSGLTFEQAKEEAAALNRNHFRGS